MLCYTRLYSLVCIQAMDNKYEQLRIITTEAEKLVRALVALFEDPEMKHAEKDLLRLTNTIVIALEEVCAIADDVLSIDPQ